MWDAFGRFEFLRRQRTRPKLVWDEHNKHGIYKSGWNPLSDLRVSFRDERDTHNKVCIIIEPPTPGAYTTSIMALTCSCVFFASALSGAEAYGFFFEKNAQSGGIDLTFRLKPFYGTEELFVNKDCTHLDVSVEHIVDSEGITTEAIVLVLSSSVGESNLPTGIPAYNRSAFSQLRDMTDAVNQLILSAESVSDRGIPVPLLSIENIADTAEHQGGGYPVADAESVPNCGPVLVATVDLGSLTPNRVVHIKRRYSYVRTCVASDQSTGDDGEETKDGENDVTLNGDQCSNCSTTYSPICSRRSSVSSYVLRYVNGSASVYHAVLSDSLGEQPVPAAEGDVNERPEFDTEVAEAEAGPKREPGPGPEATTTIVAGGGGGGGELEGSRSDCSTLSTIDTGVRLQADVSIMPSQNNHFVVPIA